MTDERHNGDEPSQSEALYKKLYETLDLTERCDLLLPVLAATGVYHGILINIVDPQRENLICRAVSLPDVFHKIRNVYLGFKFPLDRVDANAEVFRTGRPLFINRSNADDYPGVTKSRFERWGAVSLAVAPIIDASEIVGTVLVFRSEGDVEPTDVERLQSRAAHFAAGLAESAEFLRLHSLERALARQAVEQERFVSFIADINSLSDEDTIYSHILDELLELFPFELGAVMMVEGDDFKTHCVSAGTPALNDLRDEVAEFLGACRYTADINSGGMGAAVSQDMQIYFEDLEQILSIPMTDNDRRLMQVLKTPRTLLNQPIRHKGRPIGGIMMLRVSSVVSLSDEQRRLLEQLAGVAGTAIQNAKLYSLVEHQRTEIEILNGQLREQVAFLHERAATDMLTGLGNFATFEHELKRQVAECARAKGARPLSLVLIDLDDFKKLNDTHGHRAGNRLLQDVAHALRETSREMDIACRFGGDEFAVIMPGTDRKGALRAAERIRQSLINTLNYPEYADTKVTASLGVSYYNPDQNADSLLEAADKALYRAKSEGRNCIAADD